MRLLEQVLSALMVLVGMSLGNLTEDSLSNEEGVNMGVVGMALGGPPRHGLSLGEPEGVVKVGVPLSKL